MQLDRPTVADGLPEANVMTEEPTPIEPTDEGQPLDPSAPDAPTASSAEVDPIDAMRAERDEIEAKMLRVAADYQNFVRRTENNLREARRQQLMAVARAVLPVLDHFDHAMDANVSGSSPESVLQGFQIVRDELLKALEQFGVKRLTADIGDEFDPMLHEGLMRQSVEGMEPNHIAAQLQPGYALDGLTLRPVKVSITE